jgi:hypothetical protein
LPKYRNIQVVDGAENAVNAVYQATLEEFDFIFPGNSDVEFAEPLWHRIQQSGFEQLMPNLWARPILKPIVSGIHGTLYTRGFEYLQRHFPTMRYVDLVDRSIPKELLDMYAAERLGQAVSFECGGMKNVQVVDHSGLILFPVYQTGLDIFLTLFPGKRQDMEFEEDLVERLGQQTADTFMNLALAHPIPKREADGVHGTFFRRGAIERKKHFPTKRECDVENFGIPSSLRDLYRQVRTSRSED